MSYDVKAGSQRHMWEDASRSWRYVGALKRTESRNMNLGLARVGQLLPEQLQYPLRAWRHWMSGEAELRYLSSLVPRDLSAVDVGANRGIYTYWLSRLARQVYAFEPIPELAGYLRRVAGSNVRVIEQALSSRSMPAELQIPTDGALADMASSLSPLATRDRPHRRIGISTRRFDDLNIQNVGFIKIDVEGHELEVLEGAQETLRRERPTLLVEIDQRFHPRGIQEVFAYITSIGYTGRFLWQGRWRPLAAFDTSRHQTSQIEHRGTIDYAANFVFESKHT